MTKSTCTHHFKVLREAGVIKQRQRGTSRLNPLRREDLDARFPGCSTRSSPPPRLAAGANFPARSLWTAWASAP